MSSTAAALKDTPWVLDTESATCPGFAPEERPRMLPMWLRSKGSQSVSSIEDTFTIEEAEIPSWSFRLTAPGINASLHAIETLKDEVDEDDGYPAVPTDYALTVALDTVKRAGALLSEDVPLGAACTGTNGGIRITWRKLEREVRLVIPGGPEGRGYVYVHNGLSSSISDEFSFDALAGLLAWLGQR